MHQPEQLLGNQIIKKSLRLYLFTFLAAPIGYATRAILANKLPIDDVGIFYSVLWFVSIISLYNDFGLTEALQYYLPKYRYEKKFNEYTTLFIYTIGLQLISWILFSGMFFRWADRLAVHHFHSPVAAELLKIFCLYFLFINFFQVILAYFKWFQDTYASWLADFVRQLLVCLLAIVFRIYAPALDINHFWRAWVGWLSGWLLFSVLLFYQRYRHTLYYGTLVRDRSLLTTQFSYAFWIWISVNAGMLIGQVDQQIIINVLWPNDAGIYATYQSLLMIFGVLTGPIWPLIFPLVTELITKQETAKFALLQDLLYKYYLTFLLSISWLFMAFWPEIASVFFGTKFAYSWLLVSFMAPFLTLNMMLAMNYLILAWLGKAKERGVLLIVALIVNIVLNIICIVLLERWVWGALISTTMAWIVLWVGSFKELYQHYPIKIDRLYLLKNILVIGLLVILLYQTKAWYFIPSNAYRYHNILSLWGITLVYFLLLSLSNIPQIRLVVRQLRILKQPSSPST